MGFRMEPPSKKYKTIPSTKTDWKDPDWFRCAKDTVGCIVGEIPIGQFEMNKRTVWNNVYETTVGSRILYP